jgi:hypothetical protein
LTSATISLPEPNSQENIPSDLAVVPIKVIKIKISILTEALFVLSYLTTQLLSVRIHQHSEKF